MKRGRIGIYSKDGQWRGTGYVTECLWSVQRRRTQERRRLKEGKPDHPVQANDERMPTISVGKGGKGMLRTTNTVS